MKKIFYIMLIILFIIALIFNYTKNVHNDNKEIHFSQQANNSNGTYWNYSLSTNTIISEKEYYETHSPLNFGPGYTENWIFDIIGDGDVTIQWLAYKGGSLSEKDSYSITYHFEENGEYSTISES